MFRSAIAVVAFLCLSVDLNACKVPVFRYALERWPADRYALTAVINGDVSDQAADAITALNSLDNEDVNVIADVINLAELSEAELWSVEGLENDAQTPLLQVFYPERDGQRRLCWSGELTVENVNAWLQSPLRTNIIDAIQSGTSAVWVLVEGADDKQNAMLLAELELALEQATRSIAIPEGVIKRGDAPEYLKSNPGASMDDVLRCDVPLQLKFSVERLKHNDPHESALRSMIGAWTEPIEAPFVFPLFGRGRMIEPLASTEFDQQSVIAACRYLVGECSCSVKALNPGVDLILKTNWQETLSNEVVMIDAGQSADSQPLVIPPGRAHSDATTTSGKTTIPESEPNHDPNHHYWLIGIIVLGTLGISIKLRRHSH